jgi:hypothetical protein
MVAFEVLIFILMFVCLFRESKEPLSPTSLPGLVRRYASLKSNLGCRGSPASHFFIAL